jgi:hypothetical protein
MANLYEKAFKKILSEADEMTDLDAMSQTLDTKNSGVTPEDLDGQTPNDGIPTENENDLAAHTIHISKMQQRMVGELKNWITKLEEFSAFLNGTQNDSMQSRLKDCAPDTLFDKIRIAETKKIARVSMEVVSLNEMLKGYLANSKDPKFLGV